MLTAIEIKEDFKEYVEWETDFRKRNNFRQAALQDWFNIVQKSHSDLRNKLGGFGCELDITFENVNRNLSNEVFKPIISNITNLLPTLSEDMYKYYNATLDALKLPSVNAYKDASTHRMIKSSTIILNCAKSRMLAQDKMEELQDLLSQLGRYYLIYSTKPCDAKIILSTETKAFIQLGFHQGIDVGSCFTNGYSKYYLGAGKDSFVIHYYENNKHLARMWGSFTGDCDIMNVSNLYMSKGTHEGNILTAAKMLYGIIEQVEPDSILETHDQYEPSPLYKNNYGTLSFSKTPIKKLQTVPSFSHKGICYKESY